MTSAMIQNNNGDTRITAPKVRTLYITKAYVTCGKFPTAPTQISGWVVVIGPIRGFRGPAGTPIPTVIRRKRDQIEWDAGFEVTLEPYDFWLNH
jgi:hypothetical protein